MSPVFKLGLLLAVSTAALVFRLPGALCGAALVVAGARLARVPARRFFALPRPVVAMAACTVLLRTVSFFPPGLDTAHLAETAYYCLGLVLSFQAAQVFFAATTAEEIKESLVPLAGRRFSLAFSLMLSFLPRFFAVWDDCLCAYRSRGGKRGLRSLFVLLPLVLSRMIAAAVETATALESRAAGFSPAARPRGDRGSGFAPTAG